MQIKPLKEILAMSKEKWDESMAPLRARAAKAKAEQKLVQIESKLIECEKRLNEAAANKDINFDTIEDILNEAIQLEHSKEMIESVVKQLFPEA